MNNNLKDYECFEKIFLKKISLKMITIFEKFPPRKFLILQKGNPLRGKSIKGVICACFRKGATIPTPLL